MTSYEIICLAEGKTLLGYERLMTLYNGAVRSQSLGAAIAEVGVYKGGSALVMHLAAPLVMLELYDTFEGMPDGNIQEFHKKGDFNNTSLLAVQTFIDDHSPNSKNYSVWPGLFPESAYQEVLYQHPDSYGLVHLDGDYYDTTINGLEYFYPKMVKGGMMVFDDYGWPNCPGVKRALYEFFVDKPEYIQTTPGTDWQAFIIKE